MSYYKLSFTYTSPIEKEIINDVSAAELRGIGFESFAESEEGLLGYVSEALYDKKALDDKLADFLLENTWIDYIPKWVESKDWNEKWEKSYLKPIRIGNECITHASFREAGPDYTYNIVIGPKMAFGTGNRETTCLMISEMLRLDLKGRELLDMGCGTAMLAILARLGGVKWVVAIDIDEWAYNNALENIRLNHTEDMQVALGSTEKIREFGQLDIVFVNINRNVLLNDICQCTNSMKPGNILLMSGFYVEDVPAMEAECQKNGLELDSYNGGDSRVVVKVLKG